MPAQPSLIRRARGAPVQDRVKNAARQLLSIRNSAITAPTLSILRRPPESNVITSMSFSVSFLVPTGVTSVSVYTNGGSEGRNYRN